MIISKGICEAKEIAKMKKKKQPVPKPVDPQPSEPISEPGPQTNTEPQPKAELKARPPIEVHQEQQPMTSQVSLQPHKAELDLLKNMDLLKNIREVAMSGEVSGEVMKIQWVYVVDTGGQPPFHELLSAFLKDAPGMATACTFVFKLSESLDHQPQVEYWLNGEKVGEPFPHPLSNRKILEQSIQTILALPGLSDEDSNEPLLFVIGTHRDEQNKCKETLEEKEIQLCDIMKQSGCNFQYCESKRIVFDVNAKIPEQVDKDRASRLREMIANKMPDPHPIPLRYYGLELALEDLAATTSVLGDRVITMKECQNKIGDTLSFNEKTLKAALKFLCSLNVLLYYPEVKEVEELIFCDPLVLMKVVSMVMEQIYRIKYCNKGADKEWHDSCEKGLITIKQLKTQQFRNYFRSGIFTPESLFKLFEHLLIVAKVNEKDQQFFMPCLLDDLKTTEITRPNCDNYGPLVFQFLKRGHSVFAPSGLFSALVAFLLSEDCSWTNKEDADSDVKVYRNILTFHSGLLLADITLINFLTSFEVFAVCDLNCLPKIRSFIVDGLNKVKEVRNFKYVDWKETFTCKCGREERHLADIDIERKQWSCPDNPKKRGCLEDTELAWYEEGKSSNIVIIP